MWMKNQRLLFCFLISSKVNMNETSALVVLFLNFIHVNATLVWFVLSGTVLVNQGSQESSKQTLEWFWRKQSDFDLIWKANEQTKAFYQTDCQMFTLGWRICSRRSLRFIVKCRLMNWSRVLIWTCHISIQKRPLDSPLFPISFFNLTFRCRNNAE